MWILEQIVTGEEEAYPEHYEKSADGAKGSLGWWDI